MVVPDRAAAHELRRLHARQQTERGRASWRSPRIESLEGVLRRAFAEAAEEQGVALRVLPHAEEWILWQRAVAGLTAELGHDSLLPFDIDNLAGGLWRAARLVSDWGLANQAWLGASTESRWLEVAMRAVDEQAAALGALPRHRLLAWLDTHGAVGSMGPAPYLRVDTVPRAIHTTLRRLFSGQLSALMPWQDLIATDPEIRIARDAEQEWRLAAIWVREQLTRSPQANLLVIIPNLATVRDRAERVFREHLIPADVLRGDQASPLEITTPVYLSQRPTIRSAFDALSALSSPQVSGELLARWWMDPLWGDDSASWRATLARDFRQRPLAPLTAERWRAEVAQALARHPHDAGEACARRLAAADRLTQSISEQGVISPGEWGQYYSAVLDALGWPGPSADLPSASARNDLVAWQGLLEEFADLSGVIGVCDRQQALAHLRSLAGQKSLDPPSGQSGLCLSADFSTGRGYDGIWVCGLRADIWPSSPETSPYISRDALRAAGMRAVDATGQVERAQHDLQRWQQSTSQLVLSWAVSEEETLYLPSPLLAPWLPIIKDTQDPAREWLELAQAGQPSLAEILGQQRPSLEPYHDEQGLRWSPEVPVPGGAWALVEQDRCPFSAYARRRLRCGELEEAALGIDARLRGQLLHRGFEILWRDLNSRDHLRSLSAEALEQAMSNALRKIDFTALESVTGHRLSLRLKERELTRLGEIMRAATALERERPQDFKVLMEEHTLELSIGGARLSMRVDRVDELTDGSWLVIDYKSGTTRAPKWFGDDFDAIQMWLYAEALQARTAGSLAGLALMTLRSESVRFHALARHHDVLPKAKVVDDLDQLQSEARTRLAQIAQSFLLGQAQVAPRPGACERCDLPLLCRKAEWQMGAQDLEGDETADASWDEP